LLNAGSITGATAILGDTAGSVTITNAGTITGTGGTAVDLTDAGSAIFNQQAGSVSGDVLLSANADAANIVNGNVIGSISGGGGNDTVTISGGAVDSIVAGAGNDTVRVLGGVIGTTAGPGGVELGAGADTFEMSGGTIFGGVSGEGGADAPAPDRFAISGGTINGSVFGLGGGNTFQVSGSTINGSIFAGSQNDTVTISGTANVQGDATIGPDAVGLEDGNDRFSMSGGTLGGAVSGGGGNDVLAVSGGTINSFVAGNDGADQITISGGTITGDVDAETVILTGGTIGGDITGITGNTLVINDGGSAAPLVLRDGVVFSGTNAVATIINTDLSAGGTKTQFFQGFDSVTVDPSTIKFGTGTNSIGLLNLVDGSILFVDGNAVLTGTANVVGSTIDLADGAADDVFTLGGLVLNNGTIAIDLNQRTITADQLATGALTGAGVNVINVNLLGTPVFSGQTDIPIITTGGPVTGTFIAAGVPGTQSSLFTYEVVQGAGGLFIRATPANVGLVLAPQNAVDVSIVDTALDALYGINDDAIEFDLGLGNGPAMAALSNTFGVFASGQFAYTGHDGFDMSTVGISAVGPGFDATDFSAAISLDFNAAKHFGFDDQYGLNLGVFGGYASTDVALEDFAGFIDTGDADNKSAMLGGYALFRKEFNYLLVSSTAFLGETDIFNGVLDSNGNYGTDGYALTASAGHIFVLSDRMRLDLRGGLVGVTFEGDDYTDSKGNQFGGSEISFGAFKFEPGIYGDFQLENGMTLSPYARADLQQRFGYKNTASIDTVEIGFDDADFSAALSTGFNLKMSETTTMSGEVRGKLSSDSATVGGKLGIKVAF
jgi:hypothetical protein